MGTPLENFTGFNKIRFINSKDEGIAKSRRSTGELVINKYYWPHLKDEHKFFILAHEEGHIINNTRDELIADEYASKKYLAAGFKLSESVKALSQHLNTKNPVHLARTWAQFQRALKHDYQENKNRKAYRPRYESAEDVRKKLAIMQQRALIHDPNAMDQDYDQFFGIGKLAKAIFGKLKKKKPKIRIRRKPFNLRFDRYEGDDDGYSNYDGDPNAMDQDQSYDHFLGLGKKAKQRRQERHEVKMDKKRAKNEIRRARAYKIQTNADSKQIIAESKNTLAEQGIAAPSVGQQIVGAASGLISSFKGGGGGEAPDTLGAASEYAKMGPVDAGSGIANYSDASGATPGKDKKTTTIILIVVAVLIVITIIAAIFLKKGKK